MESEKVKQCPLHGSGAHPEVLVGRRLEEVFAAWYRIGDEKSEDPLDVWLIDSQGSPMHITTGSDWCLIVESSSPHEGYDMDRWGRVEVAAVGDRTPFAAHLGEDILAVREEFEPKTGRIALEVTFASGRVRSDSWAGNLRMSE
ncbi:hypothetical protein [Streptomyces sp. NBC_00063]|uniref:hypothetical protein n=1 Tax=Streptomyces sp. NBC_00063 TaxID=2975638 RepID=UPI00225BBD05|nr:hypothetical protein [Streptomyces sp. NBC_00063]MCX5441316.1 hypothetical protein [Streptomyces sp. NBC_00063]